MLVNGKEDHGHAVCARLGQLNAEFAALAREEDMRNLNQNAGAIARLRITACRSAMGEVDEDLETLADDVVALFALDACHQAHSARIVLIARVVETLGLRKAKTLIRYLHGYLLMNKIGLRFQLSGRQRHIERGVHLSGNAGSILSGPVVAGPAHGDSAELFTISEFRFGDSRNAEWRDFNSARKASMAMKSCPESNSDHRSFDPPSLSSESLR